MKAKKAPYVNDFVYFLYRYLNFWIGRTTITLGRGIRRLVHLYDSLDDLLQAADDFNGGVNGIEEDGSMQPPPTKEVLEKKQE